MDSKINKRELWVDIVKCIGIILVVFAHSGNHTLNIYIYWFHMPLFFMISGYLHKQPKTIKECSIHILTKTYQFLIPYFAFYFFVLIFVRINGDGSILLTKQDIKLVLKGGQLLRWAFGPFWFITVLYLTHISFVLINMLKNLKITFITVLIFYIISHSTILKSSYYWNADVIFFAIVFYFIGFLIKKYPRILNKYIYRITLSMSTFFIAFYTFNSTSYQLNMKGKIYNHPILDVLIPTTMCLAVFFISRTISERNIAKYISFIGTNSLVIMYLHIPVNIILKSYFQYNYIIYTIIGVFLPIILSNYIFQKFNCTKFIFLGTNLNKFKKNLNESIIKANNI